MANFTAPRSIGVGGEGVRVKGVRVKVKG